MQANEVNENAIGERQEMGQEVSEYIVEPLALLAGILTGCEEKEEIRVKDIGKLLGLIVRGARAELDIHEAGGYGARMLRDMFGEDFLANDEALMGGRDA